MMSSSANLRLFWLTLATGSLLLNTLPAGAVEIFTSPEARAKWEQEQAAELKARKERAAAEKLQKRAEKDSKTAGITKPAPSRPAAPAPAAATTASEPKVQKIESPANQSSFSTPMAPALTPWTNATPTDPAANAAPDKHGSAPSASKTRVGRAPTLAWINPDVPPKAVILCVHGLGLHNKSYKDFGERMAAIGVATYAVDVRGFGSWMNNSETNKEVDFEYCLADVAKTLEVLHKVHPGLPVFLLGESMGGAIALRATAKYPELVDGLISCVPSGDRFKQGRTELRVAFHFLGGANKKFDIGSSVVNQASESKSGGKDNAKLKEDWLADDLNRKLLSPKELLQFQRFMNENHEWAKKINDKPILMVQGADDALVKATGTLELLSNIPVNNKDVYLLVIRDAKHLIFEESQSNDQAFNNKVLRLVNGWIDDHLVKKTQAASTQTAQSP